MVTEKSRPVIDRNQDRMTQDKSILITGIAGFVGLHLAESLSKSGVALFGTLRPDEDPARVKELIENANIAISEENLLPCDIRKRDSVWEIVREIDPHEIYHLAAVTFVPATDKNPWGTF